jgi:phage-related protein
MHSLLGVRFYRSAAGREPVREWLKAMPDDHRKVIGTDLKTVQYGWPLGMPLVRKMENALWEVRSNIPGGTVRVLFTVMGSEMVLLHGFEKTSAKTPRSDLATALARLKELQT